MRTALSHSRIERFESCPLYFKATVLDKVPERKGMPLWIGSFFHAWTARYLEHLRATNQQSDLARAAVLFDECWVARTSEKGEFKEFAALPEGAYEPLAKLCLEFAQGRIFSPGHFISVEAQHCFDERWKPTSWFDAKTAFFRLKADLVRYVPDSEQVAIDDWKTSHSAWSERETAESPQLRRYAMGLALTKPEVPEFVVELHFIRMDITRQAIITREAALAERDRIMAVSDRVEKMAKSGKWDPTPGAGCGTCPLFEDRCPVRKEAAVFAGLRTEDEAVRALGRLVLLDVERDKLSAMLKAYAAQEGPVVTGGMLFGPSVKESPHYDIPAFIEWAKDHNLPLELLLKPLAKDDLRKALRKTGASAEALEELEAITQIEKWSETRLRKLRADEA